MQPGAAADADCWHRALGEPPARSGRANRPPQRASLGLRGRAPHVQLPRLRPAGRRGFWHRRGRGDGRRKAGCGTPPRRGGRNGDRWRDRLAVRRPDAREFPRCGEPAGGPALGCGSGTIACAVLRPGALCRTARRGDRLRVRGRPDGPQLMRDPATAMEAEWLSPADDGTPPATLMAEPQVRALRCAVLSTLVYADLFDYPLTHSEIQRYLIGEAATTTRVTALLDGDAGLRRYIDRTRDWVHLAGRSHLAKVRRDRAAMSADLWPIARHFGARIARLPFVRLVGVTGALAMNNAAVGDDIDLFILVQPGRLWLCRLFILAIVRLAARQGTTLCPNFLLSTDQLRLSERNLFTAHEIAQMIPLTRTPWYHAFLDANGWVRDFLPNAFAEGSTGEAPLDRRSAMRVVTRMLSTPLFDPFERWEMERKMRRLLARHEREGGSVAFSVHECRGHFAAHDARILATYSERVAAYAAALS